MLNELAIFDRLKKHSEDIKKYHLRDLFAQDPQRFSNYSFEQASLFLDYSKNFITEETLQLLFQLAKECSLENHIDGLFTGAKINFTENRAALHTALRDTSHSPIYIGTTNITTEVALMLDKMEQIVAALEKQQWLGFSGKPIVDIVNLGIGGSDLGPAMVTHALTPYHRAGLKCHFVSNVDATHLCEVIKNLNPETTLFIIASKSFNTYETLCNAESARNWLKHFCKDELKLASHFIAITACEEKAREWGAQHILSIWDWVGGRFSLWSAVGLSIAIAIGMDNFRSLLMGANAMDLHFRSSEMHKNMPVILALLAIWYINFFDVKTYAILPYDQYLHLLPTYLQQAEMESNGKSHSRNGKGVTYLTSPVVWGVAGCNGQHAFHQLLHQGTQLIPIDFILPLQSHHSLTQHHALLVANCLSQSKALMMGKTEAEVREELISQGMSATEVNNLTPHKVLLGNRPSNTLLMPKLTPYTLGALIALYEHKIFVQSIIWDINCFDQWGIELGKQFAHSIYQQIMKPDYSVNGFEHDSSTLGLMEHYKKHQLK